MMNIVESMEDAELFASHFRGKSWDAWKALLRAIFALPLSEADLETFKALTGRFSPPTSPCPEVWIAAGRRSGKSLISALIGVYMAAFVLWHQHLARGERAVVAIIAPDRKQARVVQRYVRGFLEAPLLARLVERETAEFSSLTTGASIEVLTCSFRTTRGYTCAAVIADEVAFWRSEESASPDVEVLNALRPALASLPGSLLVAISSPYARRGALYRAHRAHWGKDGDPVLFVQAPTTALNPTIRADVIETALKEDESAARSEWMAEFRQNLESLFDVDDLRACVRSGHSELPPVKGVAYSAFADPSGGRSDAFTLAIGHLDGERAVVDVLRRWPAPFNPSGVVAEAGDVLRDYRVSVVTGDHYAGEWPREAFTAHGISYQPAPLVKSGLYLAMVAYVNGGRVELPDDHGLLRELRDLERRRGASGRDRVDHPPGAQDDAANAVAGLAHELLGRSRGVSPAQLYEPGGFFFDERGTPRL